MEKLKPCPFCGANKTWMRKKMGMSYVVCDSCGASAGYWFSEKQAIEAWNTRYECTCINIYEQVVHPMDQCDNGFMCSVCGETVEDYEHYSVKGTWNYCPGCGRQVV